MSGDTDPAPVNEALEDGATGFLTKPFDRDELVQTVRQGLELSPLQGMQAMEQTLIDRAQCHHATLVEKLHQHDAASARPVTEPPPTIDSAGQRRTDYRSTMVRHMAILAKFLFNLTETHHRTLRRLATVQENIRRHALARPPRAERS